MTVGDSVKVEAVDKTAFLEHNPILQILKSKIVIRS